MSVKDLDNGRVLNVLNLFGDKLDSGAKSNLRKEGKGGGSLESSIKSEAEKFPNSFSFSFEMEDYGEFVDAGVMGIGGSRKKPNAKGELAYKLKKVTNKKFSYRTPSKTNSNGRFKQSLGGWSIRKGIAPRSSGGQFTKRKGLIFALRKSIMHTGIETTNFYTKPFNKLFKALPEDIIEAYGLEVDAFLKQAIK